VQDVKADALTAGYWSTAEIFSITADLTSEELIGQLLAGAYDSFLASFGQASGPAVEAAQQPVRCMGLRTGGFTGSVLGFGAGGTSSQAVFSPPEALAAAKACGVKLGGTRPGTPAGERQNKSRRCRSL
jgi:hypothetical protein